MTRQARWAHVGARFALQWNECRVCGVVHCCSSKCCIYWWWQTWMWHNRAQWAPILSRGSTELSRKKKILGKAELTESKVLKLCFNGPRFSRWSRMWMYQGCQRSFYLRLLWILSKCVIQCGWVQSWLTSKVAQKISHKGFPSSILLRAPFPASFEA